MPGHRVPNVIVFGEAGAGKSSLVNMLKGDTAAAVSSKAKGGTFSNTRYIKEISGVTFHIFDTAGLNEGTKGNVTPQAAIKGLYDLICQLDSGVDLLVYVMRAPRINETAQQNYEMFFNIICRKQVPIVIVVTGLEHEDNMDQWWHDNKAMFDKYKMYFEGFACVTATKGKAVNGVPMFEDEYNDSKEKVARLILSTYKKAQWKMSRTTWFVDSLMNAQNLFAKLFDNNVLAVALSLYEALISYGGLSDEEAQTEVKKIEVLDSSLSSHTTSTLSRPPSTHDSTSYVLTDVPADNTHSWLYGLFTYYLTHLP